MGNTLNLPTLLSNNDNELKKAKQIVSNLTIEIEACRTQIEVQKKMLEVDDKEITELKDKNKNLKNCDECLVCKYI